MIRAGYQDIQIDQGATFEMQFQVLDETDMPVSLAGATIRGQIRKAPESDDPAIASFTGTVMSAADGEGKVSLTPAETALIPADNSGQGERKLTTYVYDIEIEFADGTVQRILEGPCYLSPEVTRA